MSSKAVRQCSADRPTRKSRSPCSTWLRPPAGRPADRPATPHRGESQSRTPPLPLGTACSSPCGGIRNRKRPARPAPGRPENRTPPAVRKSLHVQKTSVTCLRQRFWLRLDLCLGQQNSQLRHRDHRQEADKQEEQESKQAECPGKGHVVPARGLVSAPRGRQIIARQAGDNNHETLKPHARVH